MMSACPHGNRTMHLQAAADGDGLAGDAEGSSWLDDVDKVCGGGSGGGSGDDDGGARCGLAALVCAGVGAGARGDALSRKTRTALPVGS